MRLLETLLRFSRIIIVFENRTLRKKMYLIDKTILYLEADLLLAITSLRVLSLVFKKVVHCTNGEEGLNAYYKEEFDLIFSEINLPIINGLEFTKIIRENNKEIPIYLHSDIQERDIDFDGVEISKYLEKPLALKEFVDIMREQCD